MNMASCTTDVSEIQKNEADKPARHSNYGVPGCATVKLILPTVHNIYTGQVDVNASNEVTICNNDVSIVSVNPSTKRNKINRFIYSKLHRANNAKSSVDKLKGKYENIAKQTEDTTVAPKSVNSDSAEGERNVTDKVTISGIEVCPSSDNIVGTGNEGERTDEDDDDEPEASHSTYVNNNTKVQLSRATVERLKNSIDYSQATKARKVQFSEYITRAAQEPVPKPRLSLNKNATSTDIQPECAEAVNGKEVTEEALCVKEDERLSVLPRKVSSVITIKDDSVEHLDKDTAGKGDVVEPVSIPLSEVPQSINISSSTIDALEKDVNDNDVAKEPEISDIVFAEPEERHFVLKESSSEDSVHQVENFLSDIVMDNKKPKEKKRSNSFRRLLTVGLFRNKDKKKNKKNENVTTDNVQNESSAFVRGSAQRHTIGSGYPKTEPSATPYYANRRTYTNESDAQDHVNRFNDIRNKFSHNDTHSVRHGEEYVCMDNANRNQNNPRQAYTNTSSINKYIDTSSSTTSTMESDTHCTYANAMIAEAEMRQARQNGSISRSNSYREPVPPYSRRSNEARNSLERFSATPPRSSGTHQDVQLVKPRAIIPINSDRPLPNPYRSDSDDDDEVVYRNKSRDNQYHEKTIDRNLNTNDTKEYPSKPPNGQPCLNDVYGTVFDSVQKGSEFSKVSVSPSLSSPSASSASSPKSPSLEGSKLKLPPNREKVELQPRIKSPIPQAKVSTDKIIATELLKIARSPTPTKKPPSSSSSSSPEKYNNYPDERVNNSSVHKNWSPVDKKAYQDSLRNSPAQNRGTPNRDETESNVKSKPPVSPRRQITSPQKEAADWYNEQKVIDKNPLVPIEPQKIKTNVVVHQDPHPRRNTLPTMRPETPRQMVQVNPNLYHNYIDGTVTPVDRRLSTSSVKLSPEKQEIRQKVEEFCWKELKKMMQEREQQERYYYQLTYGSADDGALYRRARSLTPTPVRGGKRSLSLPRDVRPLNGSQQLYGTARAVNTTEDRVQLRVRGQMHFTPSAEPIYGQFQRQLVRNTPERSTIGPIGNQNRSTYENYYSAQTSRPIFNRGSLSNRDFVDSQSQTLKKVSFSSPKGNTEAWPTKNGYTQSPPQRRVDKQREGSVEQEIYASKRAINNNPVNIQRSSMEPIQYKCAGVDRDLYCPLPQRHYSPRSEPIYEKSGQKQVTVTNKYCDIYGQIHDKPQQKYGSIQRTGTVYCQLQVNPNSPVALRHPPPSNFIRGTRLTASANDMYTRINRCDPRYRSDVGFEPVYGPAPSRPLPPVPNDRSSSTRRRRGPVMVSDTESDCSEWRSAHRDYDEEWNSDSKSGRGLSGNESGGGRGGDNDSEVRGRSRSARRDDPRRHTLGGDQQYGLMSGQGGPLSRTMDLEGQPRGYPPPSNAMLFDDDPGIMSEVETSSTGFRRGGKQRSSLPVVRTPSKTLERPLGLVFLQYRNETKRALLPNEITSIDTVKALFVRSFPKQLTMEYLDSPQVKIYIHDSSKDMFYELEDLRSHLREIRDRSVLRLFESADVSGGLPMAGIGIAGGVGHFEDPSYFSEPEFDSEYQHQHIHKSKGSASKGAPYYMGSTASLPRGATLLRTYSPAVGALPADRLKTLPTGAPPKPQRSYSSGGARAADGLTRSAERFAQFPRPANSLFTVPDGYMSSPERGSRAYEDPYYSQYTSRSGSITPVIDEEISDTELLDESYSLYGVKLPPGGPRAAPRAPFPPPAAIPPYDATRLRVENMERQLANLTGLVQKALTQTPTSHLQIPGRDGYRTGDEFDKNSSSSSASLPDKSVSFEKSVSFSDEPPDMNSPKQHSPQHTADTKPPKPAIKSSTLPRTSSQERDRLKPAPPPKPASLSPGQYDGRHIYRDLQLTPEMYNQLRGLQKKAKELRAEVRNLRRMSQAQAHSVRETIRDTFIKIRAMLLAGGEQVWQAGMDQERMRLSREEDLYKQEMLRLEKDLGDLESTVEELRGNVINRKTRVNMSDVENMALVLSKSSKTVADLKLRFPSLQDGMKAFLSTEMEKVVREEKFLKEEPERLESALRRCKKLTGTLVTLKRLASVQEQRLPCSTTAADGRISPSLTETPPVTPTSAQHSKPPSGTRVGPLIIGGDSTNSSDSSQRPENALDALLDELQTFSKPHPTTVNTQMPQVAFTDSGEPPAIPAKGIPPSHSSHFGHPPSMSEIGRKGSMDSASFLPTQNLTVSTATGSLRRLHSYPSGSDTDNSPPIQPLQRLQVDSKTASKPPIPERNAELLQHIAAGKRIPPPPPPRTSSKSPLASPTSPSLPPRSPAVGLQHIQNVQSMVDKPQSQFEAATQNLGLGTLRRNIANRSSIKDKAQTLPRNIGSNLQIPSDSDPISASNSSSCESVNSQDGSKKSTRKEELEQRHQELLKKQKALQEQYARLQQLQRGNNTLTVVPPAPDQLLKKTGSESNLLQKMGLQMTTTPMTGSLTHLPNTVSAASTKNTTSTTEASSSDEQSTSNTANTTTTNKVYETDIL